ncbi:MAG: PfkB family carbohydrate kinase [Promethearchaeota archaeon]
MIQNNKEFLSILYIGHISIDTIIKNGKTHSPTLGGSVSFGSIGLKSYSKKVKIRIISNCGRKNLRPSLLKRIRKKNIDLNGLKWADSDNTHFILEYFDHSRSLSLETRSKNMEMSDIPENFFLDPPNIVILAPLCNEISRQYILSILEKFPNALIGMDLQGFVRKTASNGKVSYIKNSIKLDKVKDIILKCGNRLILKGSEEEMKLLAGGGEDLVKIMTKFNNLDLKGLYIMTRGEEGSMLIKYGCNLLNIPAFKPKQVKDETGAGDIYLSIFLYEYFFSDRSWSSVRKAAFLASASASFLVEKVGPQGFKPKKKVEKRVKDRNYIIYKGD